MLRARNFIGPLPLLGVLAIALVAPGVIAFGQHRPKAGEPVIVVTAPWDTALRVASNASGRIVSPGHLDAVAMAWSDNPSFTTTLYHEGAWIVLGSDLSWALCRPVQ